MLEHTALTSIIKLSSEVTNRLIFLDVLHDLVYGNYAKRLKERRHLHKILEPHCWLFGPQFHLATSDKSFREIVPKHREKAGLPPTDDDSISDVKGIRKIPDLFLYAIREYPSDLKNHHLIVEIKAPKVSIGSTERDQIRKYGKIIRNAPEFDKISTRWDLFLISSEISEDIEDDRRQKDKPIGWLAEWDNMTIWTFTWSEIIGRAKEEMMLIREHLKIKSEQLLISKYLRENFPDVLGSLNKAADDQSTRHNHS
ncbi:MAG: hypothetical protein HQL04_03085 [Nitrospirae bacterium]|nr:hypothetical protein [Nitrospirota bacterium]